MVPDCQGVLWSTQMHGFVLTDEHGDARIGSGHLARPAGRVSPHPAGGGSYFDVLDSRITPDEFRSTGGMELRPGVPAGALVLAGRESAASAHGLMPVAVGDFVVARLCRHATGDRADQRPRAWAVDMAVGRLASRRDRKTGLGRIWSGPRFGRREASWARFGSAGREVPAFTPDGRLSMLALRVAVCRRRSVAEHLDRLAGQPAAQSPRVRIVSDPAFFRWQIRHHRDHDPGRPGAQLAGQIAQRAGRWPRPDAAPIPGPTLRQRPPKANDPAMRAKICFFDCAMGNRGELTNLRESEMTVGHLFRAAFRNMADNYAICADRLAADRPWQRLGFFGRPGAEDRAACGKLICERFAVPYRYCPVPEDAMLGLLTLGLAFTGRAGSVEQAMKIVGESF